MKLLQPLDINGMILPNRVAVPAMVTRLSGEDGYVNDDIVDRYRRYAEGEVGLIVVEAMAIHGSKSGPLLRISDDDFIPGHRRLAEAVHGASDSKVVPQIIHFMKVARSGWRQRIEDLSTEQIESIITDFGMAALRAREAGYDGVELHSAHAYTLSSFLSRRNSRKDAFSGKTLEGRLHMFGRVMAEVRSRVGHDFPVGIRFLAEEAIKDGYTIDEAKLIALRMAQAGVDYISLSVGGKFEDAQPREGHPLYPYTGYSGDRCMPGNWYPPMPHVHLAGAIKQFINAKGHQVPVISVGKISDPEDAEQLLQDGKADIIGMARQLLADPDWPAKVRQSRQDAIVHCIYCNVCKQLDENFKEVHCFLWPKGARQAPADDPNRPVPAWPDGRGDLTAEIKDGQIQLKWPAVAGVIGYDVYRATDGGVAEVAEAVKSAKYADRTVLGGLHYDYFVRPFDASGTAGPPSRQISVDMPMPEGLAAMLESADG